MKGNLSILNATSKQKGDLVVFAVHSYKRREVEYAIVEEVRDHNGVLPEEIFIRFPLDGSYGWYLSDDLKKVEINESS